MVVGATYDSVNKYFIAIESGVFYGFSYNSRSKKQSTTISLIKAAYHDSGFKLLAVCGQNKISVYSIVDGFTSVTLYASNSQTLSHEAILWQTGTGYFTTSTSLGQINRFDVTSISTHTQQTALCSNSINSMKMRLVQDSLIAACVFDQILYQVTLQNLQQTAMDVSQQIYLFALDWWRVYTVYVSNQEGSASKVEFNGYQNELLLVGQVGAYGPLSNPRNMETINHTRYIIVTDFHAIILIDVNTLSSITTKLTFENEIYQFKTLCASMPIFNGSIYTVIGKFDTVDAGNNYLDRIIIEGLPIICGTGFWLRNDTQECFNAWSIPQSFGMNNTSYLLSPCNAGCLDCRFDSTFCRLCDANAENKYL